MGEQRGGDTEIHPASRLLGGGQVLRTEFCDFDQPRQRRFRLQPRIGDGTRFDDRHGLGCGRRLGFRVIEHREVERWFRLALRHPDSPHQNVLYSTGTG